MNPPTEEMANDEAAANNTNTTRAATSNNGGSASGDDTIEAAPPPTATATTMADTPITMSEHPPGHSHDGNEVDSPEPELANDNPNYPTAAIDHDSRRDATAPSPAAMAGSELEIIEDDEGPWIPPSLSAIPFNGDSTELGATRTVASLNIGKQANAGPEMIEDDTGPALSLATMDFPDSKRITDAATGIELFEGDDEPPLSAAMVAEALDLDEGSKKPAANKNAVLNNVGQQTRGGVEIIQDSVGPPGPPSAAIPHAASALGASTISSDSAVSNWDDESMKKIHQERKEDGAVATEDEPIAVNPEAVMDEDISRRDDVELPPTGQGDVEDSHTGLLDSNQRDEEEGRDVSLGGSTHSDDPILLNASVMPAPQAYRVDEEFAIATPLDPVPPLDPALPWWKPKQVRRSFILVCAVFLAAAIALGVALPSGNNASGTPETVIIMAASTNAPSSSFAPSVSSKPTSSPSDEPSPVPSSPPSACVAKIALNRQKIDLPIDDPQLPWVVVDGQNAVVVVQDGPRWVDNPVYVMFPSLETGVGWLRFDTFLIDDLGNQDYSSVALSGKTAFVGFMEANDGVGAVLVFEQNQFGSWEKVEDPFVHASAASHYGFGGSVGIDGDLAFVSDWNNVYMFRRESNGKWAEFDRIDGFLGLHSISGDVIAAQNHGEGHIQLYKYVPDLDGVLPIQDPIPIGIVPSMDLSNDDMVYWDDDEEDAFVYRREEANQTFAFHQQLNISGPWNNRLALDSDILVVGGINSTHIFSEQDGNWEETITLDQRYEYYALSGRQLLVATSTEVHAFDIQDCAQEMPTQTPSSSQMPSSNPTTLPSTSPSPPPSIAPSSSVSPSTSTPPSQMPTSNPTTLPSTSPSPSIAPSSSALPSTSPSTSMAPSSSTSPTETCYWITIAIDYDEKPEDTLWGLGRAVGGGQELVKSHRASRFDTSYSESICLEEGEYLFNISDDWPGWDGICCDDGEGSYNVTVDGTLIVEGGEFGRWENTKFSLPFVPGTSSTTQS